VIEALAVAEAKLGRFEQASTRVDQVIETYTRLGVRGLLRAHVYMTRACIASWAGQGEVEHFTALAHAEPGAYKVLATLTATEFGVTDMQYGRASETSRSARRTGSQGGTVESVQAEIGMAELQQALDCCADTRTRAEFALDYLCHLAQGERAQLYLVGTDNQLELIAFSDRAIPDSVAVRFANEFFAQQIDDDAATEHLTHVTQMLSVPGAAAYMDEHGHPSRLFMLTCKDRGTLVYAGLVALRLKQGAPRAPLMTLHLAQIATSFLRNEDTPGLTAAGVPHLSHLLHRPI
jgi:hypothetical protein